MTAPAQDEFLKRDRARIVDRYSGRHREFLNFLVGWISARGKMDKDVELIEMADTIDAVLSAESQQDKKP